MVLEHRNMSEDLWKLRFYMLYGHRLVYKIQKRYLKFKNIQVLLHNACLMVHSYRRLDEICRFSIQDRAVLFGLLFWECWPREGQCDLSKRR